MNNLLQLLNAHEAYNIVGHMRPDGDCIGSEVALCAIIRSLGKECYLILNDSIPPNFTSFFNNIPCVSEDKINGNLPLICVDCSDFSRVGQAVKLAYNEVFLNIDHHISNDNFALNNIVNCGAASTTEILAELLMESKFAITKQISDALYLGIITDTGNFAYDSTSIKTFKIAEVLISIGTKPHQIYALAYENNTLERYRMLERLLRNMEIFGEGRLCLSFVTELDFEEIGASAFDTEGFVNYTRELRGVLIGCFLEIRNSSVKCSLRAIDRSLRVDLLANIFGGGGHPCAAGFSKSNVSISSFISSLKAALCEHVRKFYDEYHAPTR
ncbi:MAG: bifunctional oligoribonuclease/PAP phosphatase NrnA [Puniceicoccales bacterium]|jgi:phosphoesterase RecJ-like protein|nr:bifunctional oligoribonuclease/PAP phosphatase NrnA [Puniceicoccales bacterium]